MNRELRIHMRAAGDELEGAAQPCPSEAELIEYQAGRLAAERHEAVQSHLVRCGTCRATLLDVVAFFEPARPGEVEPSLRREWKALERKLPRERRLAWTWFSPRPALALAASLVVVSGIAVFTTLRTQRELGAEVAALQEKLRRTEREHQTLLARVREPQVDVALFDVFSRQTTMRSGAGGAAAVVQVRRGQSFTLILNAAGQPVYPRYAIEIVNASGERVWRSDGLVRDAQANYVLSLPGDFLSPGEYTLQVYGMAAQGDRKIADYLISLKRHSE